MAQKPKAKWRFAIGTTSRVPNSGGLHYLMLDYDTGEKLHPGFTAMGFRNAIIQKTEHGWHIYTDAVMTFKELLVVADKLGADKAWLSIGKERGYLFLADKSEIDFPYPVEHMVIHYGKKEA